MRIIEEAEYEKRCCECKSLFAYKGSDIKKQLFSLTKIVYCPVCDEYNIVHDRDRKVATKAKT